MLHVIEEPRCDLKIILSHNGAVKFLKEFYGQYTYSTKKKSNNMYTISLIPDDIICISYCTTQVLPPAVSAPIQPLCEASAPAVRVSVVRSCIRPLLCRFYPIATALSARLFSRHLPCAKTPQGDLWPFVSHPVPVRGGFGGFMTGSPPRLLTDSITLSKNRQLITKITY